MIFTVFKLLILLIFTHILLLYDAKAYDLKRNGYSFETVGDVKSTIEVPQLPDLKKYTLENILNEIPENNKTIAKIEIMKNITGFWKFTKGQPWNIIKDLQKNDMPEAIIVQSGVINIERLYQEINNPSILEKSTNSNNFDYILKRPLYINKDATLIFNGNDKNKLRLALSADEGAFIVNNGNFFVIYSDLFAWDSIKEVYQKYNNKEEFRPFLLSIAKSKTYFANSIFRNLGYSQSKSYGISFSADIKFDGKPTGWIINNLFEGLYYGFYSYEAEDVVIYNNEYSDNIIYAIDPHDRSERLIIANNITHGTRERHGIIISREVNNSIIMNNISFNNKGTGIMLDRSCVNNLVYNNLSYNNGYYGLALFESQNNILVNNTITGNGKDGLRIRNSWGIKAYDNIITGNGRNGIDIVTSDISSPERTDPFTQRGNAEIYGGVVSMNKRGGINFDKIEKLRLHGVTMPGENKNFLIGDIPLSDANYIMDMMKNGQGGEFLWTK